MRPRTNYVRFYPSPYLVLTEQGYTKHYYAGADRVCARLGSGGLDHDSSCISRNEEVSTRVESLFWHGLKLVDAKEFKPEIIKELQLVDIHGKELDWLKNVDIEKLLLRLRISVKPDPWKIHHVIDDLVRERPDDEPEVYFYHSDHLGGASWITDHHGLPVQHLQYLPYGEPYVDQRTSGYSERFRFTGKERDEETGYGYFGARYMDHELMTMWLSVDPMADKYPGISPYAYCAWNPVKLVDPDGQEDYQVDNNGNITKCKDQSHAVEGKDRLFRGRPKFDKNGQPKKSYVEATEGTFGEYNEETKRGITKYNLYYEDLDGNQVPYSPYEIKINEGSSDASERKATEIFEFLSKNTRVEWTYFGLGSPESDELQSVRITTSRIRGYEPYGFGRARRWKEWVKFAYHPHKNAKGASKDGYDDKLPELVPNATLGIYHTWSGSYFDFNGNRITGPKR